MSEQRRSTFDRANLTIALRTVRDFATSEERGRAAWLGGVLLFCLLSINALNVINSFVGRDFMTSVENRDSAAFLMWFFVYVAVFAASTVTAVLTRYCEERVGLLWRRWLTQRLITLYLDHGTYHRLITAGSITNPDQRIADDVRALTTTALGFVLMVLNGSMTFLAFAGVIWTISPFLFAVAVGYAAVGTLLTIALGRPLVRLNYDQSDKEAHLRRDLIHVREHAESVVLARREGRLKARLQRRLEELADNLSRIIVVNRNLGFFTTGYNYLIQVIPVLVVAPMFMRGDVEFGVITQATMAFGHLLGAFSLIVTQFQSLSSLAAVFSRLASLREAIDEAHQPSPSPIVVCEREGAVEYRQLTLTSPRDGRVLLKDLDVAIAPKSRVLVTGSNQSARTALFRATAGLWQHGSGEIVRPDLDQVLFVPERPYLPPATLREALLRTGQENVIGDAEILDALVKLDLELVVARADGLDCECDWQALLSLGEQHSLALARVLIAAPAFAFLDRPGTALDTPRVERILAQFSARGIGYVHFSDVDNYSCCHDVALVIAPSGEWQWRPR